MKVFLAAPFTQELDPTTGSLRSGYRKWLQRIHSALLQQGHTVLSAHEREAWGSELDTPSTALDADLRELREADVLVAYIGNPPSPGVQFELGVATAIGLPIVVLIPKGAPLPYLTPGIPAVAMAQMIEVTTDQDASAAISQALAQINTGM